MAKEVQMSIKMEPELRDEFMEAAAKTYRPAAQVVRELMRQFIAESKGASPQLATLPPGPPREHGAPARDAA